MSLAIGVDVGGTKLAAGLVDADGRVLEQVRRPTPDDDPAETAALVAAAVAELRAAAGGRDVEAVGIGAAGFVDADRARVRFAPNLAWRDEPLRDRVAAAVDLPVVVENDANAAAWAEHRYGAGRGERHLVVVTVGTGIGGGLILDGRLYRGQWGFAGEPGHLRVVPEGIACGCGNRGCWEKYASGTALVRVARSGGGPPDVDGPGVTAAAQAGERWAVEALAETGRWLGLGLAALATVLDPGVFVVGGGVVEAGELLLGPARSAYAEALPGRDHRPVADLRPATLGTDAGLVGAADLARASS